jgi:hypothetical protein
VASGAVELDDAAAQLVAVERPVVEEPEDLEGEHEAQDTSNRHK